MPLSLGRGRFGFLLTSSTNSMRTSLSSSACVLVGSETRRGEEKQKRLV